MKDSVKDIELYEAITGRSRPGAALFYDSCAPTLFKIIYSAVKQEEIANLILERTIVKIWNDIDQFNHQSSILLWMTGIAKILIRQHKAE
jgi:DNA-directed RNA polymerase specialized sigma24 family protein